MCIRDSSYTLVTPKGKLYFAQLREMLLLVSLERKGRDVYKRQALIRRILKNPVYCGKIAYGRRRTEKVHGTRNDYRLVE